MTLFDLTTGLLRDRVRMLYKLCTVLLLAFLSCYTCNAQDFTLSVTVTDETCSGNGQLSFSVDNAASTPPVNYQVFLLPNTATAIYNNTTPSVTSLTDGTYLVIASQTSNGNTVSDQQEVIIQDQTNPLLYDVTSNSTICGDDGSIMITVTQGNPQTYEILTGPTTRAPQTSNVFENLPSGTYTVRVIDNCGEGIVKAHTVLSTESVLLISPVGFPDTELPACDLITTSHIVSPQDPDIPIPMPLNATYTLYPPDGGDPIIYTQVINNFADPSGKIEQIIPFYYDTDYYYDLEIVDNCGTVYTVPNNLVRQKLTGVVGFDDAGCGEKFLILDVFKYVSPYYIEFNSYPEGFDPETFNTQHPGPFSDNHVDYGGEGIPVPYGVYEFTISDDCGHSELVTTELEELEIEAISSERNNDCENNLGGTEIVVADFELVGGNILEAPDEYTEELPFDLSGYINDDENVEIGGLPPGTYQFEVIDECGNVYPIEVVIPEFSASGLSSFARPDCTEGKGAIRVSSGYSLTSVSITVAPTEFEETLPFDASEYIGEDGSLYMNNLPPGNYTFTAGTDCSTDLTTSATVTGYEIISNSIQETRYCGAFDVTVAHESNGVAFVKFWLQKLLDPDTDTWGHPTSNTAYDDGTPNPTNSKELANNTTTNTIISTGEFRVVKSFRSFGNGEDEKTCIEILYEFEFYDDLNITDIKSLTCSGDVADVEITAVGAEPLTYKIISKNGDTSFVINNGNNNIFTGLESAIYEVRVDDPCGNFDTQPFNVAELPSLVTATAPADIEVCDEGGDNTETFDLSEQDDTILDGQSLDDVTLTYHSSYEDAENGTNPISTATDYTATIGVVQFFARVSYNESDECIAITSFKIIVRALPELQMKELWSVCEGESIIVTADPGFDSYLWSNGAETRSITVIEEGEYTVTVTNQYGCETSKTITVVNSQAPEISKINIEDWTDNDNVITVILENTTGAEDFEYSLDGLTYQDSNTFTGLEPGQYNIFVRDKYNCGTDTEEAFLLTYPKFFTPNGDGVNETWRIKFSTVEPNMYVYIFDRYGKVITGFGANSHGWDGTYNGARLPSTDYWFIVIRENGKEYKGHFSMIR